HGVRVRLEVEPPRGMALVPAVHRDRDEVRTVFEVADDDAALLPGFPPDGGEAQRAPAAFVRRGPQESTTTEPVQRAMNAPGGVHEPRRRVFRRPRWRIAHWRHLPNGRLSTVRRNKRYGRSRVQSCRTSSKRFLRLPTSRSQLISFSDVVPY